MPDLYRHSIHLIRRSQAPTGAYVASPNFDAYAFCWLRDGSFTAHAMDRCGEHDSARAFFCWAARTIEKHAGRVERAVSRVQAGKPFGAQDYLPTRFTVDGEEAGEHWWDFQLDGYGAWLWAFAEHVRRTHNHELARELANSVGLTARYLTHLWRLPGYDLWEEHVVYRHTYTLAAIYAGLRAATTLGSPVSPQVLSQIRDLVLTRAPIAPGGPLAKSLEAEPATRFVLTDRPREFHDSGAANSITRAVDASLVAVTTPYRLLEPDHPVMQATVARIEQDLHRYDGGVYRYRGDTYYGGGEWVLLAAWLGWHYAETGEIVRAGQLLRWIEAQADADGNLPEQVSDHLLAPERYDEWRRRWGAVASPLIWSHAMYLILTDALKERGEFPETAA